MAGYAIMNITGELSEGHRRYAAAIVDGASRSIAEKESGYAPGTGSSLERNPKVLAAIHSEVARRLRAEGAPVGLAVLLSVAKNEAAPAGVRVDAAKTLLSRAGHIEPRAEAAKPDTKDLSDMSQEELRKVIDQCESHLADQATPVNAPATGLSPSQAVDMFE